LPSIASPDSRAGTRLLIDTQALLWWLKDDPQLSAGARRAIADTANTRRFSIAGAWEMAIKCSIGKLTLDVPAAALLADHLPLNRIEMLALTLSDLVRLESLPWHHRDPFDRVMAAQALERDLVIVSSDNAFDAYGVERLW
jgi:PIN domain nuclease of toxin-antitoxin system